MDYTQEFSFCIGITNELNVPKQMSVEELNEWVKTEEGRNVVVSQLLTDSSNITKLIAVEAGDEAEFVGWWPIPKVWVMPCIKHCCDLAQRCSQAIKKPARGGDGEYSVGRLIAMISSTRVKFVLASPPS